MAGKKKSDGRFRSKYVHVTLHKIKNEDLDFWLQKALNFRINTVAALVGLEENKSEGKGLHAHIIIQFSTQLDLYRKAFIDHFGTDSIHISSPTSKNDLLMMLGYVAKTGVCKQKHKFTYRGVELDEDPEVYRFYYLVRTIDDGLVYFEKIIREHIKNEDIIEEYLEKENAIGRWLRKHAAHAKTLVKLAKTWNLNYLNSRKKGFKFAEFMDDPKELIIAYRAYLREYPAIFEKYKKDDNKSFLESDFDKYESDDLQALLLIKRRLEEAMRYGPNRPHKCLNLFIWSSSPSFGKSRLLKFLNRNIMTYRLPDDQYYVSYKNGVYDLLISDEAETFLKTKEYSHLKQLFEGDNVVEFNRKGMQKVTKKDNPLIILADNNPFHQVMEKFHARSFNREVFEDRVLDVRLQSRASLHFFVSRCLIGGDPEDESEVFEKEEKNT